MGNLPNSTADRSNPDTIFGYIGGLSVAGNTRPLDVLAMAETDTVSAPDTAAAARAADGGGDRTGFVYDTASVQLMGSIDLRGDVLTHNALRGHFRPVGTSGDADFYVYAVHLRSGTTTAIRSNRVIESQFLRADADALGSANVLFAGDFNWLGSDELGPDLIVSA